MTTLFIADPWDIHARSVAWGLARLDEPSVFWYTNDFPQKHAANIEIDDAVGASMPRLQIACARSSEPFTIGDTDAVWLRRWYHPTVSPALHPADAKFGRNEANEYVRSMIHLLNESDRFWVNPLLAKQRADRKATQLVHAKSVGMTIPNTLLSNDPQRIRAFFKDQGKKVIYKPFVPAAWASEDKRYSTFTSALTDDLLTSDDSLSQAPGIFQAMVEKDYELRVTVMGRSIFASRIDSQQPGYYLTDWRANIEKCELRSKRHELPQDIAQRCFDLLDRMGLVFGCIDIIVTPEGEHVFLEVNEMGQFLWLEAEDPQLPLLDCFVSFMHSRNPKFVYDERRASCSFAEFVASPAHADEPPEDSPQHVRLPNLFLLQE